jgi:2-methylaconitate cis-trans-isomerase PrpF
MRGGTSKGLFFLEQDLPEKWDERKEVILRAFGSPDPTGRQLDGLGGGTSTTSKLAIISKIPGEPNAVNYTFGQVEILTSLIDMKGNCGNISAAVGPFAIDAGLIENIEEPYTTVKIFNTNTQKYMYARVPVKEGKTEYEGDYAIPGVPTTGRKIQLDFMEPGGSVTGRLLPTHQVREWLETDSYGRYEVSIVDAANPCVFVNASDIGISGTELPKDLDNDPDFLGRILEIRGAAAVRLGLAETIQDAIQHCPAVPKACILAPSTDYVSTSGSVIRKNDVDIVARMMSMGKLHPSYAITGGICLAIASQIEGTLVHQLVSQNPHDPRMIRIGHCSGVMDVGAHVSCTDGKWHAHYGRVYRTARRLMTGTVYV